MAVGNVSLRAIYFEDFQLPFNLADGITRADAGKAVALDSSAANTVKLAGDGDEIVGRLQTVEDRPIEGLLVGTVAVRFSAALPVGAAATIAVGDTAVGAGDGTVKRLEDGEGDSAPDYSKNMVVETVTLGGVDYAVVVR